MATLWQNEIVLDGVGEMDQYLRELTALSEDIGSTPAPTCQLFITSLPEDPTLSNRHACQQNTNVQKIKILKKEKTILESNYGDGYI